MKKLMCMCVFILSLSQIFSEGRSSFEENPIRKIRLAKELAEYGYETESPTALLEAAEILAEVNVRKSAIKAVQTGTPSKAAEENQFSLDAKTLFADAKDFAGNDKTYAEWIKKIERTFSGKRGAARGPLAVEGFAYGNDGSASYTISFTNGESAQIYVAAMTGSNLDVDIYDSDGKSVVTGKGNDTIQFVPENAKSYTIQVKNRTSSTVSYTLYTD